MRNYCVFNQPVVTQDNHGEKQLLEIARLSGPTRQQWSGLRVENDEIALAAGLQVADHTCQTQRFCGTGRVPPPQV